MAFLDFLKKTKKDMPGSNTLDMPPPPPIPAQKGRQSAPPEMQGQTPFSQGFDFGAPPYPIPPKMADMPKPEFGSKAPAAASQPKEDDFGMMLPPGMPSKEELGLGQEGDMPSDMDFSSGFPSFDEPQEKKMEMPPGKQSPPQEASALQMQAPPALQAKDYPIDEPPHEEMEAPPIPQRKIKSSFDIFSTELRQAESERKRKPSSGPIFVTQAEFQDILDKNDFVRLKVKETNDTLERLSKLESGINGSYEKWRQEIVDLQKKLLLVDRKLFELEM